MISQFLYSKASETEADKGAEATAPAESKEGKSTELGDAPF